MDFESYRAVVEKRLEAQGVAWAASMEQVVYMTWSKGRDACQVADAIVQQQTTAV